MNPIFNIVSEKLVFPARPPKRARRILAFVVEFTLAMIVTTICCAAFWEVSLDGKVYSCSDGGMIDYLTPGDWVHSLASHPVTVVSKIVPPRDMSYPDAIKVGWSVDKLWHIWISLLCASLAISAAFASLPWTQAYSRWTHGTHG